MNISVAMATYNGAKYLDGQIRSILSQTLQPDEIIICDDRSTDHTADLLEKYLAQGPLVYQINNDRFGVIRNFKKAVSSAKPGNWVALSDQDDEWLSDKLERSAILLNEINDEQVPCIVYSDLIFTDKNGQVLNKSFRSIFGHDKYHHNLQTLLYTNFVTGCTVLMNLKAREWYADMPNDIVSHDEWLALIAFTFGKAVSINGATVRYRKHDANVSMRVEINPGSKFKNIIRQSLNAIIGEDDFLINQFKLIDKFYECYYKEISDEKKKIFENFLKLRKRLYPIKKMAYRRMVNQNRK